MEFSSNIRANEVDARNKERREQKGLAFSILSTQSGQEALLHSMARGGPLGRKIAIEIKRFQSSGRISGWLADQTINSAIQSSRNTKTNIDENGSIQIGSPINFETIEPFNGLQKFKPEIPSTATELDLKPWDIYVKKKENDTYTLKVRGGTISGILPENWDDEFNVSGTSLFWGIADVTTDGFSISSVSIKITQNAPETQSPVVFSSPSSAEIPFGVFQDGSSYNFAPSGNISISPKTWMILEKEEPASAGELPYEIYYTLRE
jgi:hypothetical protein